jgi:hypothetical protein
MKIKNEMKYYDVIETIRKKSGSDFEAMRVRA